MLGAKDGKGGFFPEGIAGRINTPEGFDVLAEGLDDFEGKAEATQVGFSSSASASQCYAVLSALLPASKTLGVHISKIKHAIQ